MLEDRLAPATLVVDTPNDEDGHGVLDFSLSLREAINVVNTQSTAGLNSIEQQQITGSLGFNDTIQFDPGLNGQTITLTLGALTINQSVAILGPGASQLTIDGNHVTEVFDVEAGTVSISDLTIANGNTVNPAPLSQIGLGGGIFNNSDLTLTNCTLKDNTATNNGGGIFSDSRSTLKVTNCTFSGNTATIGGGGIFNSGNLTVTNSTLSDNSAATEGGGMFNSGTLVVTVSTLAGNSAGTSDGGAILNQGRLTVTNSTLMGNFTDLAGGGAISNHATATVANSMLLGNHTGFLGGGGGIFNDGTESVTNSTLAGNSSGDDGGGGAIFNQGNLTLTNSTLAQNTTGFFGGGGILNWATLALTNCTLAANKVSTTSGAGGGISNSGKASISNTLIAGNTAPTDPDVDGGLVSLGYNLIGNPSGGSGFVATDLVGTAASPLNPLLGPLQDNGGPFAGAPGSQQVVPTMALLPGSPAIEAGSDALAVDPATSIPLFTDERGIAARVENSSVDIGAFEVQVYVVYSNADGGGGSLRSAITNADRAGGSVIAFTTGGTINLVRTLPAIDRSVQILGPGADDLTVQRSTAAGTPDFGIFVVDPPSNDIQDVTVTIAGLTIANGKSIDGAGIENFANLAVNSCTFTGNTAIGDGGGIYNQNRLAVTDSTFTGNSALDGGGITNYFTSSGTVTGSMFAGNSATAITGEGGGGIANFGTMVVTDSTLADNKAGSLGGGIENLGTLTVITSTLAGNSSTGFGGAIYNLGAFGLIKSTLSGNSAGQAGGGIETQSPSDFTWEVVNSTISDNSATFGGGIALAAGTGVVTGTTFSDNSASGNGGGLNVILGSTLALTNCTVAGNSAAGGAGGGIATAGTFTLTNCTVAGNSAFADGGGISTYLGPTNVANTIIANNTSPLGPDAFGPVASQGHNLIGDSTGSSGFTDSTDLLGLDPLLAPLGKYGGPTQTMALLPGSPAIDSGNNALVPAVLTTDQRGLARIVNGTVDIGAFESRGFTLAGAGGNNQLAIVNMPFVTPLTVVVSSLFGEPVQGGVVTFAVPSSGAGATFPGPNTSALDASGQAGVTVDANASPGSYAVTASARGANLTDFTLTNLSAITISPTSLPDATAGVAYTAPQPLTAAGGAGGPFTFAVTAGALPAGFSLSSGVLSGSTTVAGTSSFTVTATDTSSGFSASQAYTLTVDPAPAATLVLSGFPSSTTAGVAGNFAVKALDAFGNVATGYSGTVTFRSSDPLAELPGNATLTSGIGNFSAILRTAGTQSLTATDTANAVHAGSENGITVNPSATSQFVVTGFPSSVTAGVPGTFTVTAEDAFANVTPGYSGTVHFSSSDPQAVLPATATLTSGIGHFTATLKTAGTQSLTVTDTASAAVTGSEGGITVNPGVATHFGIAGPSSVTAGTSFSLTVTALDAYGNVATGYLGTVKFASSDNSAKLPSKYNYTASDQGAHTFTGLVLKKKGLQTITVLDASNNIVGTTTIDVV
jgi:parallel beta-helix repeat protein